MAAFNWNRAFVFSLSALLLISSLFIFLTADAQHQHEEDEHDHGALDYPMNFYFQGTSSLVITSEGLTDEHIPCPAFRALGGGGSEEIGTWNSPSVKSNTTIGGSTTITLHADGTASGVYFTAAVSAGGTELASGDSNSITLAGGTGTFTISLDLPHAELAAGDSISVTITYHTSGSRSTHIIVGDPSQLSMMTTMTTGINGEAEADYHGEELHIHAAISHPWGLEITGATATIKGETSVSLPPSSNKTEDGVTTFDWHVPDAHGVTEITLTITDAAGGSYTSDVHLHAHEEGGFAFESGSIGLLAGVLAGVVGVGYIGGITPLHSYWNDKNMRYLLAFSAGIFLSVAVFHALPEAYHMSGIGGLAMAGVGFATLYFVEHYVIQIIDKKFKKEGHEHHHEHHEDGQALHLHDHHAEDHEILYDDDVDPEDQACTHHLHQTSEAAFAGVAFHNLIEGMVITTLLLNPNTVAIGLVVILGIILHKAPCTLSISSLLKMGGHSAKTIKKGILILLAMTPLGAVLAITLFMGVKESTIGLALGFSAGTFLEIGGLDLLPESLEKKKGREWAVIAILLGFALLWIFSLTEGDAHVH